MEAYRRKEELLAEREKLIIALKSQVLGESWRTVIDVAIDLHGNDLELALVEQEIVYEEAFDYDDEA